MSNPGNLFICQTCTYQERTEATDQEDRCLHPQPAVGERTCNGYRPLPVQGMGERLGELYEIVHMLSETTLEQLEALDLHLQFEQEEQP